MKDHDAIRHMLSEYIEGSVSTHEREEIEGHIASCPECGAALDELKKTIEHIRTVEELEPPAWLSQKIMAKVREAAESRKSVWQKVFHPLHLKLPIEAAAVAFLAVTAFYIYQAVRPAMNTAEAPMEGFAAKQEAQAPVAPEKEEPSSVIAEDEVLTRSQKLKAEAPVPAPAAEPMPEKALEAKRERFDEEPKVTKEHEGIAPSQKQERASPSGGFTAFDEARPEAPERASRAKASAPAAKKGEGISLIVRVKEIEGAVKEVEKAVVRQSGKIIRTESTAGKRVFVVQISPDRLQDLVAKLKLVGEVEGGEKAGAVKEEKGPSAAGQSRIETRSEIIKIIIQK